jgi:hypothetical protein
MIELSSVSLCLGVELGVFFFVDLGFLDELGCVVHEAGQAVSFGVDAV